MVAMAWSKKTDGAEPLVSHSGAVLSRPVAFRFALDLTAEQSQRCFMFAGARRLAYNHHLARVKENLERRAKELDAGLGCDELTPPLSWSKVSFINEFNAYKTGRTKDSSVNADGTRGLAWREEISADVFECASVDAAAALKNDRESATGARKGRRVGFPRFAAKHRDTPRFRLRAKCRPGETASIRFVGARTLRIPKLGELRISGSGKKVARMIAAGRFHVYSASFPYSAGRWFVALTGVAAELHPARRSLKGRHLVTVGVDRGVKSLLVAADASGALVASFEGVNTLRCAEQRLKRANQALARTKPGSTGRKKAKARLARLHGEIARKRRHVAHEASLALARGTRRLALEDLHVAGMVRNRHLARSLSDAALGELGRQLTYKAAWYGTELVLVERFSPSSKTCSRCGSVKEQLSLSTRVYACEHCGLELDRDVNAAINLARWPDARAATASPKTAAA